MGGFFGAVSHQDVTLDIFFGVDYHSHLGTRRGGIGGKEAENGGVSVRLRSGEDLGMKTVEEVIEMVHTEAAEPFKKGGMSYSFA